MFVGFPVGFCPLKTPTSRQHQGRQAGDPLDGSGLGKPSLVSFIRSFVCLFVRSFVCSFVRWLIRSFVLSCVRSFVRSFLRLCVPSFVRSFVHSFVRAFIHSFIRSFIRSTCLTPNCLEEVLTGTEIPGGGGEGAGWGGGGGHWGVQEGPGSRGRGGQLYLTPHCHHQDDFGINTDSDESHVNV